MKHRDLSILKAINKKRLVLRFTHLVKIESISKNEKRAGKYIRNQLDAMGIKSRVDGAGARIGGNCGNIFASIKGNIKNSSRILFNAHIDTVTHKGKIEPAVKSGVIKSDGTTILGADCKASVAAILEAVAVIKKNNITHGDIDLLFTVAEEIGIYGAKNCDPKFLRADHGFVFDGGDVDQIINSAPSQVSFEADIKGRSAHAGTHPENGINAIKVASEAIAQIKIGRIDHETTSNVGIIAGGTARNIVPESVHITGEARSRNKAKLKRQMRRITDVLTRTCKKYKASLRLKVEPSYNLFEVKKSSRLIEVAKAAISSIGLTPKIAATGGGSDANVFNQRGLPSIILGAGFHNIHTSKEYIRVEDLVKGAELILALIIESAKTK
ncbi:MAG: M20/M25/M40 family metallo-hydrolase [Candidatus Margulisiibacteriota bacterium]